MTKQYFAYDYGDGLRFSYEARDEAAGILGSISPTNKPVAEAADLQALREKAFSHLGREPDDILYLADSDNLVYSIVSNRKHRAIVDRLSKKLWMLGAILLFCVTALVACTFRQPRNWIITASFVAVTLFYMLLVKTGFLNEVEASVLCEIILILVLLLVPALAS